MSISGTVVGYGGSRIEGAIVTLEGYDPVTTNSEGGYMIEDVPYGTYTISASSNGYITSLSRTITTDYFENGITCKAIVGTDIRLHYYWEGIDGSASGQLNGTDGAGGDVPSLAINSSGNPVVAWSYFSDGFEEIYLKQWNGTDWEELGGSASGGGISNNAGHSYPPSLAINDSGDIFVSWEDDSLGSDWEIYLKQWNGSSWEELNNVSGTSGDSMGESLAINNLGNPVVSWQDDTSGNWEIYIKQWNGSSWEEIGTGSATGGGISDTLNSSYRPSLAINGSGNPVVVWSDNTSGSDEIYLKQWDGSTWEELDGSASGGGISDTSNSSYSPSLAINASGNPVVAWSDGVYLGGCDIYIKQWNGTSWEEIGAGSALGDGISGNSAYASSPSLAINNSGNPVIAWHDDTNGGNDEIYLKQWNGSSWEELGGSASVGGIRIYNGSSSSPSLAINESGNPIVAWTSAQLYVKQYVP